MSDSVTTYAEELERNGILIYAVRGHSMQPFLREGKDVVVIEPCPAGMLQKYDMVLYRRGSSYILHRIMEIREKEFVLCGDHNRTLEEGIRGEDILGVVTGVRRNGKDRALLSAGTRCYLWFWCDHFTMRCRILRAEGALQRRWHRMDR